MIPDPLEQPVISVEAAGLVLNLGRSAAYDAARRGEIPTIRLGRRVVVPTAKLLAMLGLMEHISHSAEPNGNGAPKGAGTTSIDGPLLRGDGRAQGT